MCIYKIHIVDAGCGGAVVPTVHDDGGTCYVYKLMNFITRCSNYTRDETRPAIRVRWRRVS